MKNVSNFLTKFLVKDPHLWIAFLLVFLLLVAEALHPVIKALDNIDFEKAISYVLVVLMTVLIIDKFKESGETKKTGDEIAETNTDVKKAVKIMGEIESHVKAYDSTIRRASDPYLWGGFSGKYSVYNPSFRMDEVDQERQEYLFNIFVQRYNNHHFKSRYLFLTKDEAGKQALNFFRGMMKRVKDELPDVNWKNKIEVKEIKNKKATDEQEMYMGDWADEKRAIIELKDSFIDPEHGKPNFYLIIKDSLVVQHFLTNHFEKAWDSRSGAIKINIFE